MSMDLEINRERARDNLKEIITEKIKETIWELELNRPSNPSPDWEDIREEYNKKMTYSHIINDGVS
jgi:hypothetical protein|tara:strand:+ start:158 stop:355 length:198 start_codon:yes stop_codon:yes gene_type:complete